MTMGEERCSLMSFNGGMGAIKFHLYHFPFTLLHVLYTLYFAAACSIPGSRSRHLNRSRYELASAPGKILEIDTSSST